LRQYELTYIVRPDADDEAVAAVTARVEQVITTNGGRVLKVDPWGKRRLAYPIRRYTERFLKLSEDVFRHLLVRVEPVAVEAVEPEAAAAKPVAEAQPAAPAPTAAEAEPAEPGETEETAEPAEAGAPPEPEPAEQAAPPEPPAETD
jgi:ribosomal protein S6